MSPTQRSLKMLRGLGYSVAIVEHFNSFTKTRNDLYGFADLIAIDDYETLLIQVTSGSHTSNRVKKILANDVAKRWVGHPHRRIEVHGWRPLVAYRKDGSKAKLPRWEAKLIPVTLEDFPAGPEKQGS